MPYKDVIIVPRNETVETHVRKFGSGGGEYLEIRDFMKEAEVYGHGIILPFHKRADLIEALEMVGE